MPVKTVLYITTQIIGTWRYFSWAAYPSIWYARLQQAVLRTLDSYENIEIYVKFYPNDMVINPNKDLSNDWLKNVNVLEENLVEILKRKKFDLIVTEACATTLLEVLCTGSQVLCFFPQDYIKLNIEHLEILEKRVHLSSSEKQYIESLDLFLSSGFGENKKPLNDDFLFKFGLPDLNKQPIYLAKEYIDKIIG